MICMIDILHKTFYIFVYHTKLVVVYQQLLASDLTTNFVTLPRLLETEH